ncbi:hypothetical protein Cph01nite_04330 [Cellulomonas phragmiteti]|uniref:Uncharacterized protein n=1 Tax=Cellulomonas phragmiteti TaxID=478780 RepID=A0ABQ4DH42_9CELL|nr:hypothetical protein Cph01nite_04330 [Cellulomonas phragmiteti]
MRNCQTYTTCATIRPRYSGSWSHREKKISDDTERAYERLGSTGSTVAGVDDVTVLLARAGAGPGRVGDV